MTYRRIIRFDVPVDGHWHRIEGALAPLYVDSRKIDVVEFWAWEWPEDPTPSEYLVIGTGHPIEDTVQYVGTTIAPGRELVWHLVRRRL